MTGATIAAVRSALLALALVITPLACADDPPPQMPAAPSVAEIVRPDEEHLSRTLQVTFTGDNLESRWSSTGDQLVLQARLQDCDRIARTSPLANKPMRTPLGTGRDPAFLPGDHDIVYASAPRCTQAPDKDGLLLDPDLDIVRASADGSNPVKLTTTPGYDGEPAVCAKDGSIAKQ